MPPAPPAPRSAASGLGYAIGAYGLWGVLPLFFILLAPAGPFEIVSFRVLLALVFCALLLTVTRSWRTFGALLRTRAIWLPMTLAGILIFINWETYIWAALQGRVVETSLGYFINPLVTVLLGVIVLRERLRASQWVAVGISAIAIVVIGIGYGSFPWVALVLAFSFGLYGFVKKRVGGVVDAIGGLTLETLVLVPVVVAQLVVVGLTSGIVTGTAGAPHLVLMLCAGAVTAIPLLLFASAARRLSLVTLGLMQYVAPILQFLIGVLVLGEEMSLERWIGFGLVWVALVVLAADMVATGRAARRASLEPL